MTPEKVGENVYFTIPETAKALEITRQAVYAAINAGQLKATDGPGGKRIHAQDLVGYGLRTGRDPEELLKRVQEESGVELSDLLLWVIAGLGLYFLFKAFFGKD